MNGVPSANAVRITTNFGGNSYGLVDVDLFCCGGEGDDANDVKLVELVGSIVDKVDIIDGRVDVTENGAVDNADDVADVLLLFDDAAPIRVDIIDGRVDVTENGSVTTADDLPNTELTYEEAGFLHPWPVDIINGTIDVDGDGSVTSADDRGDVNLLIP